MPYFVVIFPVWLYGLKVGFIMILPSSGDFCRLLITFANSLIPEWRSWPGSELFDADGIPEGFIWKVNFEKKADKKDAKITQHAKS